MEEKALACRAGGWVPADAREAHGEPCFIEAVSPIPEHLAKVFPVYQCLNVITTSLLSSKCYNLKQSHVLILCSHVSLGKSLHSVFQNLQNEVGLDINSLAAIYALYASELLSENIAER